jgi:hypothetical protein
MLIGRINHVIEPPHGTWGQHVFLMLWALVRYVQQALAPATFRIHYCFAPWAGGFDLRVAGLIGAAVGLVALFVLARRVRFFGFLMAWFFACLGPVANIIPFPAVMADRYLYASSIAACLGVAWGVSFLAQRLHRPLLIGATVVLALVTVARGVFWSNPDDLWAEVVEDGACQEDTLTASTVMILKAAQSLEARDPAASLDFYAKGFSHKGFASLSPLDRSTPYSRAGLLAHRVGREDLALEWSKQAVTLEPSRAAAWLYRATSINDPVIGLDAAWRAFRLDPSAESAWVLGVMRLLNGDDGGAALVADAVRLDRDWYCPRLKETLESRPQLRRPRVELVLLSCTRGS